jgi:hypothetical protein
LQWGFKEDVMCVFSSSVEGRDHQFFHCGFSRKIWRDALKRCIVNEPITAWDEVTLWGLKALKSKSMRATICKLVSGATV